MLNAVPDDAPDDKRPDDVPVGAPSWYQGEEDESASARAAMAQIGQRL